MRVRSAEGGRQRRGRRPRPTRNPLQKRHSRACGGTPSHSRRRCSKRPSPILSSPWAARPARHSSSPASTSTRCASTPAAAAAFVIARRCPSRSAVVTATAPDPDASAASSSARQVRSASPHSPPSRARTSSGSSTGTRPPDRAGGERRLPRPRRPADHDERSRRVAQHRRPLAAAQPDDAGGRERAAPRPVAARARHAQRAARPSRPPPPRARPPPPGRAAAGRSGRPGTTRAAGRAARRTRAAPRTRRPSPCGTTSGTAARARVLAQLVDQDRHRDPECGDRLSRAAGLTRSSRSTHRRELVREQLRALDLARCSTAARGGGRARAGRRRGRRTRAGPCSTRRSRALEQLDLGRVGRRVADDDLAGRARAQHVGGRRVVVEAVALARLRPAVAADVLDAVLAGHDARDRRVVGPQHRRDHRARTSAMSSVLAHAAEPRDQVAERGAPAVGAARADAHADPDLGRRGGRGLRRERRPTARPAGRAPSPGRR